MHIIEYFFSYYLVKWYNSYQGEKLRQLIEAKLIRLQKVIQMPYMYFFKVVGLVRLNIKKLCIYPPMYSRDRKKVHSTNSEERNQTKSRSDDIILNGKKYLLI